MPKSKRKINIGVSDIENIVAKLARIPSRQVSSDDKSQLKNLENPGSESRPQTTHMY